VTSLLVPFAVPLLPRGAPFHLDALAAVRPLRTWRAHGIAAVSALVGGLSHIGLDGVTHGNHSGWALAHLPVLATPVPQPFGPVPLHDALQLWLSLILGVATLGAWRRLATARVPRLGPPAPAGVARRTLRFLGACALAGALVAPLVRRPPSPGIALELSLFGALAFVFYGAVIAALADRAIRTLDRRRRVRARFVLELAFGA
jgi:hypothetical protein